MSVMRTANGYSPPKARQMSVWLANDDIEYVTDVAERLGVTRNRAFAIMIDEHRQATERKLARAKR